jgi:sugar lactone lactonase YvrE
MNRSTLWRFSRGLTVAVAAGALFVAGASARPVAGSVASVSFDPVAGEMPEGLAIDHKGDEFVALSPRGEIREIAPDGSQSTVVSLTPAGQGFGPLGLAFDRTGDLFAAAATFNVATNGVYEIGHDRTVTRIPGSEGIGLPNALAFAPDGTLYVTDSVEGAVWRILPDRSAELWLKDPILAGDGSFGFGVPIGANGIAYRHDSLYVLNTELGRVVRIPIHRDGSPATPQLVASGPQLVGADGNQFDLHGNMYIAVNVQNALVRLDPDGTLTTLATVADGLDFPASPYFGTGRGDRKRLFVSDFALGHATPADAHPGIVSFDVGIPGSPLPAG